MDEPPRLEEPLLPSHKPAVFTALRTLAVASALVVGTLCVSIAVPALGSPASLFTGAAPMRVLVTGFKPWGNYTSNPSQDVAMQLNGSCVAGVCIEGRSLSVDRAGVDVIAHRVVEANQHWDAVIHLGFESVSKGLRIETAAANIVSSEMCHGCWSTDVPCDKGGSGWRDIHPGSPCLLATTAPLDALALPLLRPPRAPGTSGSALELWSRDAGTYYCNEIYYRTLRAVRANLVVPHSSRRLRRGLLLPVLFVHLPPPNTSSLAESAQFVRAIAAHMVDAQ